MVVCDPVKHSPTYLGAIMSEKRVSAWFLVMQEYFLVKNILCFTQLTILPMGQ